VNACEHYLPTNFAFLKVRFLLFLLSTALCIASFSYYRLERQWLHDSIIEDYLCHEEQAKNCVPVEPWLIYTCGVKGSGKRFLIDKLMQDGRLPLLSTIIVDADEIRRALPEFASYAVSPEVLAKQMNKEAGYICEILAQAALQAGNNVLLDGQLQDVVWRLKQFDQLRRLYPKLRIALIQVTAPFNVIVERIEVSEPNKLQRRPARLF
jgi:predicted kinase